MADGAATTSAGDKGASHSDSQSQSPACFLVQHNIGKKHNIGTLARSATAFGVKQVVLVGSRHFNAFGAHGSAEHVNFKHCSNLEDCRRYLKEEQGCQIVGVEIVDSAKPIQSHPFTGPTAFILGNEGQGMNQNQMNICDSFVYIPQYGPGTASLNVACAASIVLHHFAVWSGLKEREREGYKFVVAERPMRRHARGEVPLTDEEMEEKRKARAAKRAAVAAAVETGGHTEGGMDLETALADTEPAGPEADATVS